MIPSYNDDEEIGWPGLLLLALIVLAASWVSFLVAAAFLEVYVTPILF